MSQVEKAQSDAVEIPVKKLNPAANKRESVAIAYYVMKTRKRATEAENRAERFRTEIEELKHKQDRAIALVVMLAQQSPKESYKELDKKILERLVKRTDSERQIKQLQKQKDEDEKRVKALVKQKEEREKQVEELRKQKYESERELEELWRRPQE
ncbi:hypothetical protein BGX34_003533 [Mortierella sp. NVP85]|nr:hypothetical protein BGX34_003533 [Mortierella sp. NVP85]